MDIKNDDEKYRQISPVQIRFNDIDGQRHVNNAVFQSYFDIGREDYFVSINGEDYHPGGKSVVIASVKTDFRIPIFRHDKIQVETRVVAIGEKSLTMQQRITGIYDGEVKAEAVTVFSGFDYDRQKSMEILPELRAAIEAFEQRSFGDGTAAETAAP